MYFDELKLYVRKSIVCVLLIYLPKHKVHITNHYLHLVCESDDRNRLDMNGWGLFLFSIGKMITRSADLLTFDSPFVTLCMFEVVNF